MTDKEKIEIDGVDVSGCKHFLKDTEGQDYDTDEFVKGCCEAKGSCIGYEFAGYGLCKGDKDCYFKQLARKSQECEELKKTVLTKCPNCNFEYLTPKGIELYEENQNLTQECEELKKQLMQKSEVDMFFNTPIEGWSNDPCGICPHKAKNEELKKEIINKNEKIKELRFSVSDLTNRLCYLNAEKSFRIVDLEQTLDEIEKELKEDIYCENQECGCDDFEECLKCTKEHILDIINEAKDGE